MRAISLWQPWATLIAIGAKRIETRGWKTDYTGWLAIHAAKKWNEDLNAICGRVPFYRHLFDAGYRRGPISAQWRLPLGGIVAVCRVLSCVSTNVELDLQFQVNGEEQRWQLPPEYPECYFGDFSPGRYAWLLGDVKRLPKPVPFKGSQGFFEVPDDLIAQAMRGAA